MDKTRYAKPEALCEVSPKGCEACWVSQKPKLLSEGITSLQDEALQLGFLRNPTSKGPLGETKTRYAKLHPLGAGRPSLRFSEA
jgi:hypothetical protein